jgi:hypothetical protein
LKNERSANIVLGSNSDLSIWIKGKVEAEDGGDGFPEFVAFCGEYL